MPIAGSIRAEKVMNPHTFISITASIQHVYNIAKELGELLLQMRQFPEQRAVAKQNAERQLQ